MPTPTGNGKPANGRRARRRAMRLALALWVPTIVGAGVAASFGDEPILPIPLAVDVDPAKARLGEQLFTDVRLSSSQTLSCASCHRLRQNGADDLPRPLGSDGQPLPFNTPTIFNAALSSRLNWRGDSRTLEEQADGTLRNPRVMNIAWDELLTRLRADAAYARAFATLYPDGLQPAAVLDALAAFERTLLTPNARFDQYLRGRREALSEREEQGYGLFKTYGCVACHQGVNVGGNLFQKFGVFRFPFRSQEALSEADLGRFTLTGKARDRFVFRAPSLRNVAVTAPYFHDGATRALGQAVDWMAKTQLGQPITPQDAELIVAFLHTLTGEYQGRPVADGATP